MIEKLLLKLQARDAITDAEAAALAGLVDEIRLFPARKTVIRKGEDLDQSLLLLDGVMCRYKDLRNGRRQISALHIAGDFLDLHSFTLKRLDHDVMSLSPTRVAIVPHVRLMRVTEALPHLTRLLWFSTNLDAAMHREWELSLGQRTALSRSAHLICELQARLQLVGLATEAGFDLTLNQTELAECLGITSVHMNRVLRELREADLVTVRSRQVVIHDLSRLQRLAEFDPTYLYLDRRPR